MWYLLVTVCVSLAEMLCRHCNIMDSLIILLLLYTWNKIGKHQIKNPEPFKRSPNSSFLKKELRQSCSSLLFKLVTHINIHMYTICQSFMSPRPLLLPRFVCL